MAVTDASNTRAVSIFITYLSTNFFLFQLTVASIGDFSRSPSRKSNRGVLLFNILQSVSLGVTWYYMSSFFGLSYRSWASDHGVPLPAIPDLKSLGQVGEALAAIRLGPWLKDVKLFRDAWETVVETPARTCWSLPIFFITMAWSVFIAKEGMILLCRDTAGSTNVTWFAAPRRGIKYAWAYMLLGQLVAISFAMNLFFQAVLLHPIQSTASSSVMTTKSKTRDQQDKSKASMADRKPPLWVPWSSIYWLILGLTFISTGMTCVSAGQEYFLLLLAVPHLLLLLPPVLHSLLPSKLGRIQPDSPTYNSYYDLKLAVTMVLGIAFEAVALYTALNGTLPATRHLHRHSNVHTYPGQQALELGTESPWQNLWGSLWDHPAVSSVGWDSILCTASFATWMLIS